MKQKFMIVGLILVLIVLVYPKNKITNFKIDNIGYKEGNVKTASDYLIDKANDDSVIKYEDGKKEEMYTFNHGKENDETTLQAGSLTDYRFIGNNPNNYVYFNCSDDSKQDTCEVWRIVGVFEVESSDGNIEKRVKIIRGSSLDEKLAWDSKKNNDWSKASLNTYLNSDYYNTLSESAQVMIGDVKYYLGGSDKYNNLSGADYYKFERETQVFSGQSTAWTGKIALMYPSDYVYTYALGVDDKCYKTGSYCTKDYAVKGWLYNSNTNNNSKSPIFQWILSPFASTSINAFSVHSNGTVDGCGSQKEDPDDDSNVDKKWSVRPVLYLASDIYIENGDGSESNPYRLATPKREEVVEPSDQPDASEDANEQRNDRIEDNNINSNPKTYDGIILYITIGLVSLGLIGLTVKKYLFR